MLQAMEAEIMFDGPEGRDRAIVELAKRGYAIELLLDRVDGCGTPTVWITVRGATELDEDQFFDTMKRVAEPFGGTVLKAGLQIGAFRGPAPYSDDFAKSYDDCLRAVRERVAAGGKGWTPK